MSIGFRLQNPSYQDETESALPDRPHVANEGRGEQHQAQAEAGPAQLAQEAGPEVVADGLLGRGADLEPLSGDDVEREVLHVLRHRHQQHGHKQQ